MFVNIMIFNRFLKHCWNYLFSYL